MRPARAGPHLRRSPGRGSGAQRALGFPDGAVSVIRIIETARAPAPTDRRGSSIRTPAPAAARAGGCSYTEATRKPCPYRSDRQREHLLAQRARRASAVVLPLLNANASASEALRGAQHRPTPAEGIEY